MTQTEAEQFETITDGAGEACRNADQSLAHIEHLANGHEQNDVLPPTDQEMYWLRELKAIADRSEKKAAELVSTAHDQGSISVHDLAELNAARERAKQAAQLLEAFERKLAQRPTHPGLAETDPANDVGRGGVAVDERRTLLGSRDAAADGVLIGTPIVAGETGMLTQWAASPHWSSGVNWMGDLIGKGRFKQHVPKHSAPGPGSVTALPSVPGREFLNEGARQVEAITAKAREHLQTIERLAANGKLTPLIVPVAETAEKAAKQAASDAKKLMDQVIEARRAPGQTDQVLIVEDLKTAKKHVAELAELIQAVEAAHKARADAKEEEPPADERRIVLDDATKNILTGTALTGFGLGALMLTRRLCLATGQPAVCDVIISSVPGLVTTEPQYY